jgi:GntR family transcriptional regulator
MQKTNTDFTGALGGSPTRWIRAYSLCLRVLGEGKAALELPSTGVMMSSTAFSKRALYLQVWDALTGRITSGAWKAGSAIPNESDLSHELGVSLGTVRKALKLMEAQRLVTRRQGRGTFVNDHAAHEFADRFNSLRTADGVPVCGQTKSAELAKGAANGLECTRLRLRPDEPVFRIHRIRDHNGRVFLIEDITLPAALFPGLDDKKTIADHIGSLAQEYGILLGKSEERISMGMPPAAIANALLVSPGTPVTVLDRVVLMLDCDRPVEWRLVHCLLADAYYLAEMG